METCRREVTEVPQANVGISLLYMKKLKHLFLYYIKDKICLPVILSEIQDFFFLLLSSDRQTDYINVLHMLRPCKRTTIPINKKLHLEAYTELQYVILPECVSVSPWDKAGRCWC